MWEWCRVCAHRHPELLLYIHPANSEPAHDHIDSQDRLYVAAYLVGKIFRVDPNGKVCTLAKGMSLASAAAFGVNPQGNEDGFAEKNLYVTSHSGVLYELQNVLD